MIKIVEKEDFSTCPSLTSSITLKTVNPQQKIIHIDMDCFYAAVEMRDRPDLTFKPLAVGGRPEARGVIATCNYVARRFKVHSALSSREALRRCPDLIILPPRFPAYKKESDKIISLFKQVTQRIEPISLDEAYLDVTDNTLFSGNATKTAQHIRNQILQHTGLSASAGIAQNKFLAKIASEWNKPGGQLTIQPHEVSDFVKTLPVRKLPGVGKTTQKKLNDLNIKTCLDLQSLDLSQICYHFGSFGERLYDLCRGIDHSTVKENRKRKSLSVETTFNKDINDWNAIKKNVEELFNELTLRQKKSSVTEDQIKTIFVKYKTSEFINSTRESTIDNISLPNSSDNSNSVTKKHFLELAQKHYWEINSPVRLIGLGFKLKSKNIKKPMNQLFLNL